MFTRTGKILLLLAFLALLAGCGTNSLTATRQGSLSNIPTGKGNQPEQGTDGKPKPLPEGHSESILVANGITYVGSDNGQVYAFDERSGKILWQRKQSANYLRAIVNGVIISLGSTDDTVYGLNSANGAILWGHRPVDIDHVQVANGIVYVDTGNSAFPAYIYAYQAQSGALLWQHFQGPDGLGMVSISNGRVYDAPLAEASDGSLEAQTITVLDASSGRVLWHLTIPTQDGFVRDGIAEANGVTYIATNHGSMYAVQAETGQTLWHVSQSASGINDQEITEVTPVVNGGIVFAGSVQHIFAYLASDGKQLWQYTSQVYNGPPVGMQPFVANGVVYFVSSSPSGTLVALRASDGTLVWQKPQVETAPDGLVLVNGLLINLVGTLTVWRSSDGGQVWQRTTDNGEGPPGLGSPVVIGDGNIYLGGENGVIQAFQLSDGTQLWKYQIQELPVQEPPVYIASVTFSKTTTYDQAIQIVGDLGLKTFAFCKSEWVPGDDRAGYASDPTFTVSASTNSAPLWLERLKATPGVAQAQAIQGVYSCPIDRIGPTRRLSESQAGTYLRVSFASGTAYLKAWESLNALGFRLADPCYEKARAQGNKPTWQPMGEESSFVQTHTLVLATTEFNATTWQQQLQSVAGIGQIQVLTGVTCSA